MFSFKQFLIEEEKSAFQEVKADLEDTPAISMGKKLVAKGANMVTQGAGNLVGPVSSIAQGDVIGTMLSLGKNASPIGMAHSALMMGKEANATPYPLESEIESQNAKDDLLSAAMNPNDNAVPQKGPAELKRAEFRRKQQEYMSNVGSDEY